MIRSRRHKNRRNFGSRRSERSAQASAHGLNMNKHGSRTQPVVRLNKPIVLIGLMGAGKTTIGRRLARSLNVSFSDSDYEIEKAAKMSVSDIFESYGEEEFRAVERRVIARLVDGKPHVIATGGGAFMDKATRSLIKEKAISLWLDADIDVLVERTSRRDTRPLLKGGNPEQILRDLAAKRNPIYKQAALSVKSSEGPHENVVSKILKTLKHHQKTKLSEEKRNISDAG